MGLAPRHTATKRQSWIRAHIPVPLANRQGTCVTELAEGSQGMAQTLRGGPMGRGVEKALALPLQQMAGVKRFPSCCEIALECQRAQKTCVPEPRGAHGGGLPGRDSLCLGSRSSPRGLT